MYYSSSRFSFFAYLNFVLLCHRPTRGGAVRSDQALHKSGLVRYLALEVGSSPFLMFRVGSGDSGKMVPEATMVLVSVNIDTAAKLTFHHAASVAAWPVMSSPLIKA